MKHTPTTSRGSLTAARNARSSARTRSRQGALHRPTEAARRFRFGSGDDRIAGRTLQASVPALVAFLPVLGLAGAQGGYFPSAWGWASLPLFWVSAIALVVRSEIRLSGAELVFVGTLAAFTGWIALSTVWSAAPAESMLETQRALVYLAGLVAVLLVSKSRFAWHVLGGILAAISLITAFSLATRLVPDRVLVHDRTAVYRLAQPIGYWNGLALFTAMGALVAFAFAARARTIVARATCASVLVLLLPTFYFTFGRAGWIALAVGLVTAVAVDPRRLQLLAALFAVAPAPAVATWIASREAGLTHAGASLSHAVHDGHRLGLALLLLAAFNAATSAAFAVAERRVPVGLRGQRAFAFAVAFAVAVAIAAVFVRSGGPVALAHKAYVAFKAPPPHVSGNLNRRLLSFSGNGRADLWRLAWDDATRHPLLGAGSGTYERYFLAHQPADVGRVRDAHGLYIETLAELGPIGLALLIAVLAVPLAAIGTARQHPLVPGAFGAYVAYLVHTGVDWDWELPAVTLVALLCGAAILVSARQSVRAGPVSLPVRWIGVGTVVAAAAFAAIGLVGNTALSRSEAARERGDWVRAAGDARRAAPWMPWSAEPWAALGRAQLGAHLLPEARTSFRKAISLDAGDWRLWYDLASASFGRARQRALREATALFPRSDLLAAARSRGPAK